MLKISMEKGGKPNGIAPIIIDEPTLAAYVWGFVRLLLRLSEKDRELLYRLARLAERGQIEGGKG